MTWDQRPANQPASSARRRTHHCHYLLAALLAQLLFYPVFAQGPGWAILGTLLNAATLLAGILAVSERKRDWIISTAIAIPQVTLTVIAILLGTGLLAIPSILLFVAFFVFTLTRLLAYVVRGRTVTADKISAAVSIYLLMGLAWASIYVLIDSLAPGSFVSLNGAIPTDSSGKPDYIYFSFVTLTTLGYGDITPASSAVRPLIVLESLGGVLYIAVLIARLVSLYDPRTAEDK